MCILIGKWNSPEVQNRPKPMGVMTFTRINYNKAVVYAGNYVEVEDTVRSDELFVFDLNTKVSVF